MKKIMSSFFILLMSTVLVSCWENKNIEKELTYESNSTQKSQIVINDNKEEYSEEFQLKKSEKDIKELSLFEVWNSIYWKKWWEKIREKIEELSAVNQTFENKAKAIFLESFLWDYESSLINREKLCETDTGNKFCQKASLNIISYRPKDTSWKILDNVTISINWNKSTTLKWKMSLEVENKFIHRIKISKEWYLDYFVEQFIDSPRIMDLSINPTLFKATAEKIILSNTWSEQSSENFTYSILPDSFANSNGEIYSWKVKLYFFDINEMNWDLNVLNLDVFDEDENYQGNSMVTHWMPLIQAYDMEGNELFIDKWIRGKWKIQSKDKAVWMDLEWVVKNEWMWKKALDKYNIPPFWRLNTISWIWEESQMKILDSEWNYEFVLK